MNTVADNAALLADILANPAEDWLRLVYADWYEDNGQPERAEFIRVQIEAESMRVPGSVVERRLWVREKELLENDNNDYEWFWPRGELPGKWTWTYRRGFVNSVTYTLAGWYGQEESGGGCGFCRPDNGGDAWVPVDGVCPQCGRVGKRVVGLGLALVRAHPIESVRMDDVKPLPFPGGGCTISRHLAGTRHGSLVPDTIFRLLRGSKEIKPNVDMRYDDEECALDALSEALIEWAKETPCR